MENRCLGCMKLKGRGPVCEHCGFPENTHNESHQLPMGTVLQGRYVIGRVLGQGGFGITYLGWDASGKLPVAIKEYFPGSLVSRNSSVSKAVAATRDARAFQAGRKRFLKEADTLLRLRKLPNVVKFYGLFQENNTAYIVMEYVKGITLQQYVRQRGGRLTVSETFTILRPVMRALHQVHNENILHRDISPDNIMLQEDGTLKLLDFGIARTLDASGMQLTHSTQAALKYGFAPVEQYLDGRAIDRRADEYALCATVYYCLTGSKPTDALQRQLEKTHLNWRAIPGLTDGQRSALEKGSAIDVRNRYPDLKLLERALFGSGPDPYQRWKKWLLGGIAALAAAAVLAGILGLALGNQEEPAPAPASESTLESTSESTEATLITILETTQETVPEPEDTWKNNVLMADYATKQADGAYYVLGSKYNRSSISTITFLNTLQDAPAEAWDVSELKNGRVMAWVEANGTMYDLYIAGDGGVRAPKYCNGLFAWYTGVEQIWFNDSFHVTADVIKMNLMFYGCHSLGSLDLRGFDTSQVTDMSYMFYKCFTLEEVDVSTFDTANVVDMKAMFSECNDLKALDLENFNTSGVVDMSLMFQNCLALRTIHISGFDTSKVTNMQEMFCYCTALEEINISSFDTSEVTNMHSMFYECGTLKSLDLSTFDTSKVTDMGFMFSGCESLESLDVDEELFNTSKVTTMRAMFQACSALKALNLKSFDTSMVTDMGYMFFVCSKLEKLEINPERFNTAKVADMECMFYECSALMSLDISKFNTSSVTNMHSMFDKCKNLKSIDASSFDTSQVTDMSYMFYSCTSLETLNLGTWETGKVTNYKNFMDSDRKYNGRPWEELFKKPESTGPASTVPSTEATGPASAAS